MASGILIWEKNKIDLTNPNVDITITDTTATDNGQAFVDQMRNRKNDSGWATTDSNDAANTRIDVVMSEEPELAEILLIQMNFKAYTIQYFDGATFVDFSTPINETVNAKPDKRHSFDAVTPTDGKIRIIITGAFIVDDDKFLRQLILTQLIGQFTRFPAIVDVEDGRRRRGIRMLSGKKKIIKSTGNFKAALEQNNEVTLNDLALQESMFESFFGFLVSLGGFEETQFRTVRFGYRDRDVFHMDCENEYAPIHEDGFYQHGTPIDIKLVESP